MSVTETCQDCESTRIMWVSTKCSDRFYAGIGEREHGGYVLNDLNIGGDDYVEFDFCLDCGQVQGRWPVPEHDLERDEDIDESDG
jgi:hypothetical protein